MTGDTAEMLEKREHCNVAGTIIILRTAENCYHPERYQVKNVSPARKPLPRMNQSVTFLTAIAL